MAVPSFLIKNGSGDFLSKQKNLFDILSSMEKERIPTATEDKFMEVDLPNAELRESKKRRRKETKQFRGKESLFKEPIDLPLRFRTSYKVPDFQKNPHKWTKYSLADITQDDMSNESNTAAALSFLREIKIQKKQQKIKMEIKNNKIKVNPSSSHLFSPPNQDREVLSNDRDCDKPVFKSSKLIMPEYVVGQALKVAKITTKKVVGEKSKEIYLNHIHEYEDE